MTEAPWFRNDPRENPAELIVLGNRPKSRRSKMAGKKKHKKHKKGKMPAALKAYWAKHRHKNAPGKKHHKKHTTKAAYRPRRRARSNAPGSMMGGWIVLPSMQEGLWSLIGGIGLPFVEKVSTNLLGGFLPILQAGIPNVALGFVGGSIAAGVANKFAGPVAGKVVMILNTGRAGARLAYHVSGGVVGLADGAENPGLNAYTDEVMGALPDLSALPELGADAGEPEGMPATVGADSITGGL